MATFVLIPGAGGRAWYWHRLPPELRGHDVVAVDLPADDDAAGLREYADTVVSAIGGRTGVVLVAQSMGGLTAPLVCARVPVERLVLVNAMVPAPGETGAEWWGNTGQPRAAAELAVRQGRTPSEELDPMEIFFHDVPPDVAAEAMREEPRQSSAPFEEPWPLSAWPDTPTVFLQGRDDRLFPLEWQRRLVRDRLGIPVEDLPGGHLVALARPRELAASLVRAAS
ncbi:alpha/beta fold hydrolase [Actinomadura sediminis]|uniref:Alpha/beta fold hydrolase n=1 Tax=Actinomadura sediminis TaxID=1038904 RepID=A0ABW3ETW2_9ACTN